MAEPIRPAEHRIKKRGRPNPLDDSDFAKLVAQAFVDGQTRQQMCETFGVKDRDTITHWRRDPRVKAHTSKLIEDRVLQITRRVDTEIETRLSHADNLTTRELLEIRKEFLGGQLREQHEKADAETTTEAMEAMENNPDLAKQLEELASGATKD